MLFLVVFDNQVQHTTLKNRAVRRFIDVTKGIANPIYLKGWSNANNPIPKNRKTTFSAVNATVSYVILAIFRDVCEMLGVA